MRHASPSVPELQDGATEAQDIQTVKVLLGVDPGRVEEGSDTPVKDMSLDVKIAWPAEFIDGRVPFARFYPRGKELKAHRAAARQWMGQDD